MRGWEPELCLDFRRGGRQCSWLREEREELGGNSGPNEGLNHGDNKSPTSAKHNRKDGEREIFVRGFIRSFNSVKPVRDIAIINFSKASIPSDVGSTANFIISNV